MCGMTVATVVVSCRKSDLSGASMKIEMQLNNQSHEEHSHTECDGDDCQLPCRGIFRFSIWGYDVG